MKITKSQPGFSLIEVLISTALFVIIITAAMNIFKIVIESQQSAIATQNVEESLKYFLEVTSKEIRMAKRNNSPCPGVGALDIYGKTTNAYGDVLSFRNYHDECVTYSLQVADGIQRFSIIRGLSLPNYYITPAKINIDELRFVIGSTPQPTVTMDLLAHAIGRKDDDSLMRIQTTLSSRYYKKN